MNGFEKMRAFCGKADCCEVEGRECPFEHVCRLVAGLPFELTDEEISTLVNLAQEENTGTIIWTEVTTEGEGEEQRFACKMPEDGQDVLLTMKDGSVRADTCWTLLENGA